MQETIKPAVVTVGDELIYGERSNDNEVWLLRTLWQRGIPANIALSLPDNEQNIGAWIKQLKTTGHSPILVSGGIGGTHDDRTREGIAEGLDLPLVQHDACLKLLKKLTDKFDVELSEQMRRMAMLPEGSKLIANSIGAPGFYVDDVYGFPGFPNMLQPMATAVLDSLFPNQEQNWLIREIVLPVSEGAVADDMEKFSTEHRDAHIGLYPSAEKLRQEVTIRFRGPANQLKLAEAFDRLIQNMKNRLGLN